MKANVDFPEPEAGSPSQGHAPAGALDVAPIDAAIDRAMAEQRIVGTVVLVKKDGRTAYQRAAGFADREAGRPMDLGSIFLWASITKPVVAVAVMRLVEAGVIGVHDPVNKWLPYFRPRTRGGAYATINIHHLLTHTAGLTYGFLQQGMGTYRQAQIPSGLDAPGPDLEEVTRRIASAPLEYEPGARWGYSVAYDVLGAVLERAVGLPLPQIVEEVVLSPAGMSDAGFRVADRLRLAVPYANVPSGAPVRMDDPHTATLNGGEVQFSPLRLFDSRAYPSAGAGMAGTAADAMRLLENIRKGGGSLLEEETVHVMKRLHVDASASTQGPGWGFGYGWAVLGDPGKAGSPQSTGTIQWGGAYGHRWFVDAERGLTVVALTNTAFEGMLGRFTADLRNAVYETVAADSR